MANLAPAKTSSYRDTANLGLGVRPRGATARNLVWFGPFGPDALGHSSTFYPTRRQIQFQTPYPMQFQLPRVRLEKPWSLKTCDQNTTKTLNIIHQVLSGKYFSGQSSAPHYQVAKSSRANFACRFQLTAGVLQLKVASMTT